MFTGDQKTSSALNAIALSQKNQNKKLDLYQIVRLKCRCKLDCFKCDGRGVLLVERFPFGVNELGSQVLLLLLFYF